NDYILLTLHRQENVDDRERLNGILEGLKLLYQELNLPIIYPVHPRTEKMLKTFNLDVPEGLTIIPPVSFLDFLNLEKNARLILTDSGGVQEEACILKVPCVTLRYNTERPETIKVGGNILSGTDPTKIVECGKKMLSIARDWENPFGDGQAAEEIMRVLSANLKQE
ncbi:MAG: UDP-N-acetylglucosamine 2-epimerase, partial [Nanoarchaeota archaeon]